MKNFKNPAEMFISGAEQEEQPKKKPKPAALEEEQPQGVNIPKGYMLVKQYKTERMQLLVTPDTKKAIKRAAALQGVSMNDYVNNIIAEYLEREGE